MALRNLLNQSVAIRNPGATKDRHGKPVLDVAVTVPARFERKYRTIVTPDREREPIHGMVFVGPSATVEVGAQIDYQGELYRVMELAEPVGRNGRVHHRELMVQLWSFTS